jgi:hypothetical protein
VIRWRSEVEGLVFQMQTTRWAVTLCALTILPVFGPAAWAQQSPPDGSVGKPPGARPDASWTVVLTPSAGDSTSGSPAWSQQDVEEGRSRCAQLLKGLDLVAVPADPIREGEACGTPAPMKLVSIGSNPPIAFSPPPMLTCEMIAALHKWLQDDVQRLARKHLGAPVVGVKVMSAYSCRNAYGRTKTRLSEHGRANALDFGEFLTAQGETALVVADWGPIARETTAKATAEQAETIKRQAEAAAAARKGKVSEEPRVAAPSGTKIFQGGAVQIGIPGLTKRSDTETSFGWTAPSRLGGPKEAETASPAAHNGKATFLHAIHKAACAIFSTVLGPEANTAHKNHFHLDMAKRTSGNICE